MKKENLQEYASPCITVYNVKLAKSVLTSSVDRAKTGSGSDDDGTEDYTIKSFDWGN